MSPTLQCCDIALQCCIVHSTVSYSFVILCMCSTVQFCLVHSKVSYSLQFCVIQRATVHTMYSFVLNIVKKSTLQCSAIQCSAQECLSVMFVKREEMQCYSLYSALFCT